jgi:hypothetical protein
LIDQIRFSSPVSIKDVWPNEAVNFTPWLAGNLTVLDDLGLGSREFLDSEVTIPGTGRALDILARTSTERLVAIENQYSKADHDHLTRGLAYAIGPSAPYLVIIAESHADESLAVAEYPNSVAALSGDTEQLAVQVFLVEVKAESVGEYVIPSFLPVLKPNPFLKAVGEIRPPSASVEWTWEKYLEQFPTDRVRLARLAAERIEQELVARQIPWQLRLRKGYAAFQRAGNYNAMVVDFSWNKPVQVAVKLPAAPGALGLSSPFPALVEI